MHIILSLLDSMVRSFHSWIKLFQNAVVKYNAYVCPGSSFLPEFDWEITRGGHRSGRKNYNLIGNAIVMIGGLLLLTLFMKSTSPVGAYRKMAVWPCLD